MGAVDKKKFRQSLKQQLVFLRRSCESYDKGYKDEAIRIAVTIRVLVHDTRRSTSLLKHVGAKEIRIWTTVPQSPMPEGEFEVGYMFSLGVIKVGVKYGGATYGPNLQDFTSSKDTLPVDEWWNQLVYILVPKTKLTRKNIVLAAANKNGGAHVDERLTPEYEALKKEVFGTLVVAK